MEREAARGPAAAASLCWLALTLHGTWDVLDVTGSGPLFLCLGTSAGSQQCQSREGLTCEDSSLRVGGGLGSVGVAE